MKTIKAYQRTMSILSSKTIKLEFDEMVYKLAEHNPTEFLKIYDAIVAEKSINELSENNQIMSEALSVAKSEGKVACIKYLREKLNLGLKEAKELSEAKIVPYM